jgi:hypothetical protein
MFLAIAALAALLILPGTAVGANKATVHFVAKLKDTACTHTGEFFGLGAASTTATATERGRHGTNYLVLRAKFQWWNGGAYQALAAFGPYRSVTFPNDASDHSLPQPFSWAFRPEDVGGSFRWRIQYQYWDKRKGKDRRIVEKVRLTNPCVA